MSAVGLDIGTYSIKAVNAKGGLKPQILRTVEVFNPAGISLPTDDAGIDKLSKVMESMFTDHKLPNKDVRLSLPEQLVSTKVIAIPPLTDAELASAIGWQAEQHIPIPLEELALEYQVLYRPPKGEKEQKMLVLLVGARKAVTEKYLQVFLNIGIEPTLLETQTISTLRALQFTAQDPVTMVVSLGATTMDMSIIRQGLPTFVFSHLNGGQLLTRTIEQGVGLDAKQAEEYKRTYGLMENEFEGKIRTTLMPTVKILVAEMRKAQQFYANQYPGENITRLLLSGGGAQLPGLLQFITSELGIEVLMAEPFATATGEIPQTNHPVFSVAMGLVMKEI